MGTSFYGRGGSSTGSGGSSDYNSIKNAPIKNIGGSTKLATVLCVLDAGHYNVQGKYKVDTNDTEHNVNPFLDVLVYNDANTGHKVIQYFEAEDDTVYLKTYVYDGTTQLKSNTIDLGSNNGSIQW